MPVGGERGHPAPDPALLAVVQANCDLADARHAREASLCNYLLGLRELYRWESATDDADVPDRASVIAWIGRREAHWETLLDDQERDYLPLPIGTGVAPFDEAAAKAGLAGSGLVYCAGLKRFGQPEFLLAARTGTRRINDLVVDLVGREYARGCNPPLATYRHGRVTVRTDVVRRWLANRLETVDALNQQAPVSRALASRPASGDAPSARIDALMPVMIELLVQHESGEHEAGRLLGDDWALMLESIGDRRRELVLRAIRDLLADSLVTLPWLLDAAPPAALHLWWASVDGMRRHLEPAFAPAYDRAIAGDRAPFTDLVAASAPRWLHLAQSVLLAWRQGDVDELARLTAVADVEA